MISTNWRDDYGLKRADYETMGIEEYLDCGFRALGAARVIGQPKPPTITLCVLGADGYPLERYIGSDLLVSPRFEGLRLTAQDIFLAGTR